MRGSSRFSIRVRSFSLFGVILDDSVSCAMQPGRQTPETVTTSLTLLDTDGSIETVLRTGQPLRDVCLQSATLVHIIRLLDHTSIQGRDPAQANYFTLPLIQVTHGVGNVEPTSINYTVASYHWRRT
jgi:hypothetical protein